MPRHSPIDAAAPKNEITTERNAMTDTATPFKPKKSVALSGVAAGNTALCTVGRSANDLH
jgi:hypothetical protein